MAEIPEITVDDAIQRVAAGAYLIDVREQNEWDEGHAPLAHLLPMSEINSRIDEVPADSEVLVICHLGGRSLRVSKALAEAGLRPVNVLGGMEAWRVAGGPVES